MKVFPARSWLSLLILFSITIDILWYRYVGFIRDDAFITFRFAHNLSIGRGFVFNPGEQIYGSSSPGFAILMAAWLTLFSNQPIPGALFLNILASALSLVIVWKLLGAFSLSDLQRALVLFVLVWSDKLLLHSLEGMETSLVVTWMLASAYFLIRNRPAMAGIMAGLMLWLRIDSAIWIVALSLAFFAFNSSSRILTAKYVLTFLTVTGLVYLPWLIFAWQTYGTIIPHTAIAKQVAYAINAPPWTHRLSMFAWMTPVSLVSDPILDNVGASITYLIALYGAWIYRRSIFIWILLIFFDLQTVALIALNMTVEQRYFTTSLYALLILFGLGLCAIHIPAKPGVVLLGMYAIVTLVFAFPRIQHLSLRAYYVQDTLTNMGIWLHENTLADSVTYLEPLGFIGYYADRVMIDDVGLISPKVTELKRRQVDSFTIPVLLEADYVILHCDDAKRAPEGFPYNHVAARFDPLDFESGKPWSDPVVQRTACYQINTR
ncbi:MAG TPA: hypothetical protein VJM08_00875 [Anaerolineales bacterium]|nr:hypothetical protein [Anaerolineales bacterium]